MEIQGDLIILPPTNHLPLPWSVRGPLGLATGTEVSLALIRTPGRMPDIIVTPLQSKYLDETFTLEVELGERPGAVADFLSWFGTCAHERTHNNVNIVLSETITLEGRQRHKIHLVLEPAVGHSLTKEVLIEVIAEIVEAHPGDILSSDVRSTYSDVRQDYMLQARLLVEEGWLKYAGWMEEIVRECGDILDEYDTTKVVVSSSPDQRLLRYIFPRKNVFELRVPHENTPGALREIANVIGQAGNNILSSRLSRTPPYSYSPPSTSVFVASCEPLSGEWDDQKLIDMFRKVDTSYMIGNVRRLPGRAAGETLYLKPPRTERVEIDEEIATLRDRLRADLAKDYIDRHQLWPRCFVFISRRFFKKAQHPLLFEEQETTLERMTRALESEGCAVVQAADPDTQTGDKMRKRVHYAVFATLWASDASAVLALSEERIDDSPVDPNKGSGRISTSMAHEIGFFEGRNRPVQIFVSEKRDLQPIFGNIVGQNRITYADAPLAFVDDASDSILKRAQGWARMICGARGSG